MNRNIIDLNFSEFLKDVFYINTLFDNVVFSLKTISAFDKLEEEIQEFNKSYIDEIKNVSMVVT